MAQTFSAKEAAQECGTDARTLRKFLREFLPQDEQPGQGGRYSFTKGEVTKIKKAFGSWAKNGSKGTKDEAPVTDAPPAKKGKGKGKVKEEAPAIEELSDEDLVDLEDLDGPELEELEDLEDDDTNED